MPEEAPLPWQAVVDVPTIHPCLSFLGAMCACPPLPHLCWSLWCRHLGSSLSAHLSLGGDSLVSMHGKYWVVASHSAKLGIRSRIWEEEALWLCMFDTSLRSGLFQLWKGHVSREVRHGRFVTWKRSQGPEDCTKWWSLSSCFFLASYVKFPLDLTLYCLPWWVVRVIHERRIWSLCQTVVS